MLQLEVARTWKNTVATISN